MIILHEKRDCNLYKLAWSEVKGFLNKYHKQKAGKPTDINYGLFKDEELVGVATFAPCRYKAKKYSADWEWMRLCYKTNVVVKGGTSRFIKEFTEEYGGSIVSYQFESFEGNMFEGLGFELISKRRSDVYINPITGNSTRYRFINDKRDKKLQEFLASNPDKKVADYFGYTEVQKDMICYTWYRKATPIGYVYKITSPEGKIYIGQKKGNSFVDSYWSSSQNKDYWNDIKKFGKEAFSREVIEWCYTLQELNEREVYWIKECKSTVDEGGYNICISFPQIIRTEEVNRKLKKSSDIYWSNPENHIKHGNIIKNSERYRESRKTVGPLIAKGLNELTPEEKEAKYSFTQTADFKEKIKQNSTGKHWYNNGKENIFAIECPEGYTEGMLPTKRKGQAFTEEHKENLHKCHTGRKWWNNGIDSVQAFKCPGEEWVSGRIVHKKEKECWWTNGVEQRKSTTCPGKGWWKGRLGAWYPSIGLKEFKKLFAITSYTNLAKIFGVSVAVIASFCKNNNIRKTSVGSADEGE